MNISKQLLLIVLGLLVASLSIHVDANPMPIPEESQTVAATTAGKKPPQQGQSSSFLGTALRVVAAGGGEIARQVVSGQVFREPNPAAPLKA
ncbi:hypothetical protein BKA69DRAFT_618384 [Paraphysoderma sedebokerense]|nr:hypothetical protein BKA69DRAFT_618384 [Paraphysoderma sedebokerense]